VAFSPDGRTLAAVGMFAPLSFYDPNGRGDRGFSIELGVALPAKLAFSPDGRTLACGCRNGGIYLLDTATRKWLRCLAGLAHNAPMVEPPDKPSGITSLAFSRDGKTLAAGGTDRIIHVWEMSSWKERSFGGPAAR
jgi:WD40 repeat protein